MKNNRLFKILLIIVIIAAIVGITLLFKNKGKDKEASEEEVKGAENLTQLVVTLTNGFNTRFFGQELLFEKDKTTYEDLTRGCVLFAASNYVIDFDLENSIQNNILTSIEVNYKYSMNDYTPFKGEAIRQAIKELFDVEFKNESAIDEANFGYNFIYIEEFDIYLKGRNSSFAYPNSDNFIKTRINKKTKNKDKNIETEIAVAYVTKENDEYVYSKKASGSNKVYTTNEIGDIDKDQLDEFDHYIITYKENDGKYSFVSIAKK